MSSERRRIASAATLILVAYGLSRVLGAVRELVIANNFGTSHQIDDYRVAFGVPDLLFNLLLAGAISSAFIPVLSEHLAKGENQRAREIAQRVLNAAVVILTVGAVVLFIVAPFYVSLIAFGYSAHDHEVIVGLTRILLLQPIFLGAGGMGIGILTAYPRFLAPALPPPFFYRALIVAAALFSARSRASARGALDSLRRGTGLAVRLTIFVLVPASVGLALLGVPIAAALFERGQFGPDSVRQTAFALTFFSLGLAGQAATALLVRVFYALQDVMTPLRISLVVIGVNLATNIALVHLLAQVGLALGTSIAATLNAILLGRALRGRLGGLEGRQILRTARRAVVGVVPMAAIVAGVAFVITGGSLQGGRRPLVAGLVAAALPALSYLGVEVLLRSEEVGLVRSVIRRDRSRV